MRGYPQQFVDCGHRPRGNHVEASAGRFGFARGDRHPVVQSELAHRARQEFGPQPARLYQEDGTLDERRDDEPRKPRSRTDVDPGGASLRLETH